MIRVDSVPRSQRESRLKFLREEARGSVLCGKEFVLVLLLKEQEREAGKRE